MQISKTLTILGVTAGLAAIVPAAQSAHAKTTANPVPHALQGTWYGKYSDGTTGKSAVKYRLTKYTFKQGAAKPQAKIIKQLLSTITLINTRIPRIAIIYLKSLTKSTSTATGN
ncbi:hypothetical protein [Lentilactobacillus rapi]|uniref:hypothetical protein n=1 Tax=Lentilactobacillus rapi TaxID=481723 RepID=UPI000AAED05F|nr:hypothetical protein [Lentilactobacillus rapi]